MSANASCVAMTARNCPGRKRRSALAETTQIVTACHVHNLYSVTPPTAMTPEEYDKLSPEERDIKDRENRARERQEQAGIHDRIYPSDYRLSRTLISSPLHMEARTW